MHTAVKSPLLIKVLQCPFADNLHSQLQETTKLFPDPGSHGALLHYRCLLYQRSCEGGPLFPCTVDSMSLFWSFT